MVARYGGTAGRVFVKGGNETVDDEARSVLATPKGREVLTFVGRPGLPPGMEDRQTVAKPFYVLGQSLTKHLIEAIGLEAFVGSILPHVLNTAKFEAAKEAGCDALLTRGQISSNPQGLRVAILGDRAVAGCKGTCEHHADAPTDAPITDLKST